MIHGQTGERGILQGKQLVFHANVNISVTFKKAINTKFKITLNYLSGGYWVQVNHQIGDFHCYFGHKMFYFKTVTAWNMQTLLKDITIHNFSDPNVHLLITAVQWRSWGTRLRRLSEWEVQDQPSFWWGNEWSGKN